jgi:hypothetical protein
MGRGATTKPAQQQNTIATGAENTALGNESTIGNALMPSLTNELNNPGYTPAQQAAINNASLGALKTQYNSARQGAQNMAATTGNSASLTPTMDSMAQQEASGLAQQNAANQEAFANDAQKQRAQAQEILDTLYGQQNQLFGSAAGSATGTASTLANGSNPWYDTVVPSGIGAALGSLAP